MVSVESLFKILIAIKENADTATSNRGDCKRLASMASQQEHIVKSLVNSRDERVRHAMVFVYESYTGILRVIKKYGRKSTLVRFFSASKISEQFRDAEKDFNAAIAGLNPYTLLLVHENSTGGSRNQATTKDPVISKAAQAKADKDFKRVEELVKHEFQPGAAVIKAVFEADDEEDLLDALEDVNDRAYEEGMLQKADKEGKLVTKLGQLLSHKQKVVQHTALEALEALCMNSISAAQLASSPSYLKLVVKFLKDDYEPPNAERTLKDNMSSVAATVLMNMAEHMQDGDPTESELEMDPKFEEHSHVISDAIFKVKAIDALLELFSDDDPSNDIYAAMALAKLTSNSRAVNRIQRRNGEDVFLSLIDHMKNSIEHDRNVTRRIIKYSERALNNIDEDEYPCDPWDSDEEDVDSEDDEDEDDDDEEESDDEDVTQRMSQMSFRDGEIKCKFCDRTFSSQSGCNQHTAAKHPQTSSSNLTCRDCGSSFDSRNQLFAHIREAHE